MKYTNQINDKVSVLGFGGMRFPTLENGEIDIAKTEKMLNHAHDKGVNYFDTAYYYHDGKSETVFGEILSKWDRSSYFLADKMPTWDCKTANDVERIFNDQLKKCRVDYFDYYLVHSVDCGNHTNIEKANIIPQLVEKRNQGKIRHLGFSFHGDIPLLKKLLDTYNCFEFVQLQLNYFDWDYNNAKELHSIVRSHKLPIIIMEPVRGGMLANLSPTANKIFTDANNDVSVASWAIRYAMQLEGVLTVLSGMSNMEQVTDNLKNADMPYLTENDYAVIDKAVNDFKKNSLILCTGCRYCMECTVGIDIPAAFRLYNNYKISRWYDGFKNGYEKMNVKPEACISCGKCMEKCPQGIDIISKMQELNNLIENAHE